MKKKIIFFLIAGFLFSWHALQAREGDYENIQWNAGDINDEGYYTSRAETHTRFIVNNKIKAGKPILKGKKAVAEIGDIRDRFVNKDYYFDQYKRIKQDPRWNRWHDYVLFIHEKGRVGHMERRMGKHQLIVSDPEGVFMQRVTAERWPKIENTLLDNKLKPHIIYDAEGNEAAVLYIGKGAYVRQRFNDDGLVLLRITTN